MRRAVSTIGAVLISTGALAGDAPFSVTGRLTFGATDRLAGADLFLYANGTIRLDFNPVPLGLELGSYGFVNALDSPHETYGALTWDGFSGRLSAGVPRPAYDSFAISALERGFPTLGADRSRLTRSAATWGAMFDGYLPLGLRYEHVVGALRYAVSAHHANNAGVSLASFGLAWNQSPLALSAAMEGHNGGGSAIGGKLQALWTQGPAEIGLGVFAPAVFRNTGIVEGFANYKLQDRFTLTGVVQSPFDGGTPTAGLSGRYDINGWSGVSAGVASIAGNTPAFNAMIDLDF